VHSQFTFKFTFKITLTIIEIAFLSLIIRHFLIPPLVTLYVKNSTLARRLELLFQYFVSIFMSCSGSTAPSAPRRSLLGTETGTESESETHSESELPEPRGELNETATLTVRCQLPWPKAEWVAQGCQVADGNAEVSKAILSQERD